MSRGKFTVADIRTMAVFVGVDRAALRRLVELARSAARLPRGQKIGLREPPAFSSPQPTVSDTTPPQVPPEVGP